MGKNRLGPTRATPRTETWRTRARLAPATRARRASKRGERGKSPSAHMAHVSIETWLTSALAALARGTGTVAHVANVNCHVSLLVSVGRARRTVARLAHVGGAAVAARARERRRRAAPRWRRDYYCSELACVAVQWHRNSITARAPCCRRSHCASESTCPWESPESAVRLGRLGFLERRRT